MARSGAKKADSKEDDDDLGRRLDKWLWYARFFKSRSLATRFCHSGRLRINGTVIRKAHLNVHVGDVLTFPKAEDIRVVEIVELGRRRGPAPEAQALYKDLAPPEAPAVKRAKKAASANAVREPGSGRPTKRERRDLDKLRGE